jgi:putative DNA primase/helicase
MAPVSTQLLRLLPNHKADLERSGLNERTIAAWAAYSIEADQKWAMSQLGFSHLDPPALALPILPPDRIKPDLNDVMLKPDVPRLDKRGHSAKYEARPRSRNRIHAPLAIREKLTDVSTRLVITEGQKKAEKAAQEGICAIALAGVWNWKDRVGESSFPIGDFEFLALAGRHVLLCFDSDAVSNPHVRRAEQDLAAFLIKRFDASVFVTRLPPGSDGGKVGLDDFLLIYGVEQFWELQDHAPSLGSRAATFSQTDWPTPAPLGDELPAVDDFQLELLPSSLRPLVDDVSERMQTPPDFAAVAAVVTLAGCVNRRAVITPKAEDSSWSVIPNLWGAIVGPPGYMKSPVLRAITLPLARIEDLWRAEHAEASSEYETAKEQAELRHQAWREDCKRAFKGNKPVPIEPDNTISAPAQKRLVLTDATFEKLHEILGENPAGVLVVRDELTGWLAQLDKQGREGERGFFLQAWNGDGGFTIDRIGRGSIHVPAICVSLLGNIQPGRLRWYLSEVLEGGPTDDGLFQRFQLLVWPDPPRNWRLVDRSPNCAAAVAAEKVYAQLANLSSDSPVQMRFDPDAQQLFNQWWTALENTLRNESGLSASLVAHFAKYRSLLPSLAGLFELADLAAAENLSAAALVSLNHTRQAAALCDFLGTHARRVYASVISHESRAARELARHIRIKDVSEAFALRSIYLKGWSGLDSAERVRGALSILEGAGWVRRVPSTPHPGGGRPSEEWLVSPKVVRHEK